MDCKNCEQKQRQFYCESCLRSHLRDFRLQTQHFASDRDEQVSKASGALEAMRDARVTRANVAWWEERVRVLDAGLRRLRRENEIERERLRAIRESLSTRRQHLTSARLHPDPLRDPSTSEEARELAELAVTISRARSGLVQELVEVFNIVEVGGRPPLGGRAGSKGEWTIGTLVLPVPGDIRRYPPAHVNAVITLTIHFLTLLTFYLGIKLPFEIAWSERRLGVGQPWIGAGRGTELGSWARWTAKHPLHLSSSNTPQQRDASSTALSSTSASQALSESYTPTPPPQTSFTTAFAMLLYNVCYLAHTQSIDIPLSQAGDVLSNLWAVCCSAELGRRSHATHPLLPPPTPTLFPLEFIQLLQAMTASPTPRRLNPKSLAPAPSRSRIGREKENVIEEEEGWDFVEDL